jgi:prevent-host-death family protein
MLSGIAMFPQIGAHDAKAKLAELLRQVQGGQRFTITRRGKPIADLVPSGTAAELDFDRAIEEMVNFARLTGIDPADVAAWVGEGRR